MKKFHIVSFLVLALNGFSQSFPYLNASSGNENEFPVDQDTSIYMFHGSRLVKTDKDFNTIWAKTYSGFTISNLLLSKTGSMYFIGRSLTTSVACLFGKLDQNGNINWIKTTQPVSAVLSGSNSVSYTVECKSILLDRNNDLVITGSDQNLGSSTKGYLIKTDTNGNVLKFKSFFSGGAGKAQCYKLSILNDSMGYYKIVGGGFLGLGPSEVVSMHSYSDQTDQFVSSHIFFRPGISFGNGWQLKRSKFSNRFYIQTSLQSPITTNPFAGLAQFDQYTVKKWNNTVSNLNGSSYAFAGHCEESDNGDIFYTATTGHTQEYFTSAIIKLDSNGVFNPGSATAVLNGYDLGGTWAMSTTSISAPPRVIKADNYYLDATGWYFPSNPVTIQKYNSSMTWSCASTVSCNISNSSAIDTDTTHVPTITPIASYTIPSFSSVATNTTFSVNTDFCLVEDVAIVLKNREEIKIYPNPATEKLAITNIDWTSAEIYDISGKQVKVFRNDEEINVSDLNEGIYFIRVKTAESEFNKKFIKN